MLRRFAFALIGTLAFPALAQDATPAPAPTPVAAVKYATVQVALETSAGTITVEVETQRAPITAANFLRYVDQKRLDGTSFYRADQVAPNYGLIQGGPKNDPKRVLKPIAHEPTTKTGLSNTDGAISMARAAPGTATGDFFIIIGDMSALDAKPDQPGDNQGFAAFGHVAEGMDIVRKILVAPTSPTEGEGVMKGHMLQPRITILHARRVS